MQIYDPAYGYLFAQYPPIKSVTTLRGRCGRCPFALSSVGHRCPNELLRLRLVRWRRVASCAYSSAYIPSKSPVYAYLTAGWVFYGSKVRANVTKPMAPRLLRRFVQLFIIVVAF